MLKSIAYRLSAFAAMQIFAFYGLFKPDQVQMFIDDAHAGKVMRENHRKLDAMTHQTVKVDGSD